MPGPVKDSGRQETPTQCEIISVEDSDSQRTVAKAEAEDKGIKKNAFSMLMSRNKPVKKVEIIEKVEKTVSRSEQTKTKDSSLKTLSEDVGMISNATHTSTGALSGFQLLASSALSNSKNTTSSLAGGDLGGLETQLLENVAFFPSFLPCSKQYSTMYQNTTPATYLPCVLELPDFPSVSHTGLSHTELASVDYAATIDSIQDVVSCEVSQVSESCNNVQNGTELSFERQSKISGEEWKIAFEYLSNQQDKKSVLDVFSLALQANTTSPALFQSGALPSLHHVVQFGKDYLATFDSRKASKVSSPELPDFPADIDISTVLQGMSALLQGASKHTILTGNSRDWHTFISSLNSGDHAQAMHAISRVVLPGIPPLGYCPVPGSGIVLTGESEVSLSELVDFICNESSRALLEVNATEEYTAKALTTLLTESTSSHRVTRSVDSGSNTGTKAAVSLWSGDSSGSSKRGILGMFTDKGSKKKKDGKMKEPTQVVVDLTAAAAATVEPTGKLDGSILYVDMADTWLDELAGVSKVLEDVTETTHIPLFVTCSQVPSYLVNTASAFTMYTGYSSIPDEQYISSMDDDSEPTPLLTFLHQHDLLSNLQIESLKQYRGQTCSSMFEHTAAGMRVAIPNQLNRMHVLELRKDDIMTTAVVYFVGILRFMGYCHELDSLFKLVMHTVAANIPFSVQQDDLQSSTSNKVYETVSCISDCRFFSGPTCRTITGPAISKDSAPSVIEVNYDDDEDYVARFITSLATGVTSCAPFSSAGTQTCTMFKSSLPCLMVSVGPIFTLPSNVFHLTSPYSVQFPLPTLPSSSAGLPCLAKLDCSQRILETEQVNSGKQMVMPTVVYEPALQSHFPTPHVSSNKNRIIQTACLTAESSSSIETLFLEFAASQMSKRKNEQSNLIQHIPAHSLSGLGDSVVDGKLTFHRPEHITHIPITLKNVCFVSKPELYRAPASTSTYPRTITRVLAHRYVIKYKDQCRLLRYHDGTFTADFEAVVKRVSDIMACLDTSTRQSLARVVLTRQHANALNAEILLDGRITLESRNSLAAMGMGTVSEADLVDMLCAGFYCAQLVVDSTSAVQLHSEAMPYIPGKALTQWLQNAQQLDPIAALYSPAYMYQLLRENKVARYIIPRSLDIYQDSLLQPHMNSAVALQLLSFQCAALLNEVCFSCLDNCTCRGSMARIEKQYLCQFGDSQDMVVPEYMYSIGTFEPEVAQQCTEQVMKQVLNCGCGGSACVKCAVASAKLEWCTIPNDNAAIFKYEESLDLVRCSAMALKSKFASHTTQCKSNVCGGCASVTTLKGRASRTMYEDVSSSDELDLPVITSASLDVAPSSVPTNCYKDPVQPSVAESVCDDFDLSQQAYTVDFISHCDTLNSQREGQKLVFGTVEYGMALNKTETTLHSSFTYKDPIRLANYAYESKDYSIDVTETLAVQQDSVYGFGDCNIVKHPAVQYDECLVKSGLSGEFLHVSPGESSEECRLYSTDQDLLDMIQCKQSLKGSISATTMSDYKKQLQHQERSTGVAQAALDERMDMCFYAQNLLRSQWAQPARSAEYLSYHNNLLPSSTVTGTLYTLQQLIVSQCSKRFLSMDCQTYTTTLPMVIHILQLYSTLHRAYQHDSLRNKQAPTNRRANSKRYTSFQPYFGSIGDSSNGVYDRYIKLLYK